MTSLLTCTVLGGSLVAADAIGAEMEELMQNKAFLESVLSTLPGVNPEQALRNLREMTEASSSSAQTQGGGEGGEGKEEEAMELEKTESKTKDE
jgi:ribosomal protein L12E/L44/L45/RPP1/RPP2